MNYAISDTAPPPVEGPQLPPEGIPLPAPSVSHTPITAAPEPEAHSVEESSSSEEEEEECPWAEAKSPEGYTYYWHKTTHG